MMRRAVSAAVIGLAMIAGPVSAAERGYTVTEFDRVQVDGAFAVAVETGSGTSVRALGDTQAIERLSITVRGRTLVIRALASGWGGYPGANPGKVTIRVGAPSLISAALNGAGALTIGKMRGARLSASLDGSGSVSIATVDADRLTAAVAGSGTMTIGGKALLASIRNDGAGIFDGSALVVSDLTLAATGSGSATVTARRSATVAANGSGNVDILGTPACTVTASGAGTVTCGKAKTALR